MSFANTSTLYTGNCFAYLVRPSRGVSVMVSSSNSCIGVFRIDFSRGFYFLVPFRSCLYSVRTVIELFKKRVIPVSTYEIVAYMLICYIFDCF